ncbi:MAG: HipA domain-containing protein [Bacteroidales bacterium]|nr:HipA domain-containing protein [Bacteroidales bacterium]
MNRCPITYELCGDLQYSENGLRLISPKLTQLQLINYSSEQLLTEAMERATRMSIQGVQPKLSMVLNIKDGVFEIADKRGRFILKPQHPNFKELPQNEDLTMKLASLIDIEVPIHGLVYSEGGSLHYFIKRFDRKGQKDRIAVEDFAQLAGLSRYTKYNYSMEKLIRLIDEYCTFPAVEKSKLFKLVLFNFLVGNEDMHLKNYSVITRDGKVELSPAYDLLNSSIVLKGNIEEIALPLKGKKSNLNQDVLVNYFGKDRCQLTNRIIDQTLGSIQAALPAWAELLEISFLSAEMKDKYRSLLNKRAAILGF